jgi:acetolactate synthase-1/2/3 large subunit
MHGGHAVVDSLRNEGVRHVFNVPGESFTSILDGMREAQQIQLITNRHEGGACLMAEAYAKATRTPGVCVVTRGPGATHASIGIHCARHDSTPLVLLVEEAQYPNRPSGTDFVNPDFAALGTAYRALGMQVTRDSDFLPALQEALKANRPALIEVMTELEFISPTATLSQVTAGQPGR